MRVLVSTTAFTPPPFLPDSIYFGLDFLHAHRLARLAVDMVKHLPELFPGSSTPQFIAKQFPEPLRFQQPISARLFDQRIWKIQLNRDAHNAERWHQRKSSVKSGRSL